MIDFHSHILPGMDDGSHSPEESAGMIRSYSERITDICLTPHFYPSDDNPAKFFARREKAYNELLGALGDEKHPELHLGAEVHYFYGIHRSAEMENFKIEGTRLILVEMPVGKWNIRMMDELLELNRNFGLRPVLAHIDRYRFAKGGNTGCLSYFLENRGLVQLNAEALLSFWTRKKAVSMIRRNMIHFLGSDAHNMTSRKPNMDDAVNYLASSKAGDTIDFLEYNSKKYFY